MNLAVDIGNTSAKCFIFKAGRLVRVHPYANLKEAELKNLFKKYPIEASVVSSVIKDDKAVKAFLRKKSSFLELNSSTPLPFRIRYRTPKTLGNDRIAAVAGARKLLPRKNVLVIDAGTCIKYDFINSRGEYLGGSISPGLTMRFAALNKFTDKLPLLNPEKLPAHFIGNTTRASLLTGVELGIVHEMNGFAERYMNKFPSLSIIMTGGDAIRFVRAANFPIFAVPHLTGTGLNEILEYNLNL